MNNEPILPNPPLPKEDTMPLNNRQIELTQSALTYARDHLAHLYSRELREYPSEEDIIEASKEIAEFLSSPLDHEVKLYALDFGFSYHYEKMEETSCASPLISDVILTAKKIAGAFA